jgi:hypothetical protein
LPTNFISEFRLLLMFHRDYFRYNLTNKGRC